MVRAPRGRSNHKQRNNGVGIQLRAGNDGGGSKYLPIVNDMKITQSWMRVHDSSLNSQKVQNTSGHLINTPSILPATRVQHAVISMSTT